MRNMMFLSFNILQTYVGWNKNDTLCSLTFVVNGEKVSVKTQG